jgi:hypothetical protein
MHLIGMFVVWGSKAGRSFLKKEEMKDSGTVVVGCANG